MWYEITFDDNTTKVIEADRFHFKAQSIVFYLKRLLVEIVPYDRINYMTEAVIKPGSP